ncbi:MAG: hypothetical protein ACYS32_16850 [Planctomycetota bacterium]|jgi:hypothetical protein
MKPAKNIEKHIKNIYVESLPATTSAELDERVLGNVMEALEESKKKNWAAVGPKIWRIIMKSPITKIAAAAVIIIAVFIGINYNGGSIDGASVAFAEIKKAVNKMPLLHKVLQTERDGKKFHTENWYSFESKTVLSEYAIDGKCFKISSLDYYTKENIVYDPDSDIVRISYRVDVDSGGGPSSPWLIVGDYIEQYVWQDAEVSHEKGLYEGNDVDIYFFSIACNFRDEREEAEFIVNQNSHLPILYKRRFWSPEGRLGIVQVISFDFPEGGPEDIYDLGVPGTTKVVYDSKSRKRLDRKRKLLEDKEVYEQQFKEVYHLKEGEVLKYIPPSLAESRIKIDKISRAVGQLVREGRQIITPMTTGERERKSNEDHYTMFRWDGEIVIVRESRPVFGKDGVSLKAAFERIIGLSEFEYDIPDNLLTIEIPGDWIVRKGISKEQQLRAFEKIVQNYTNRPIRFERRQIERDVIVARGKFRFKPLIGTYDDNWIHVYSDKLDPDERGGGGSYSLDSFLTQRLAEIQLKQQVVNLTKSSDNVRIKCGCHESGYLGKIAPGPERIVKLDLLLENLSRQTSLVFTKEHREVDIWYVVEDDKN